MTSNRIELITYIFLLLNKFLQFLLILVHHYLRLNIINNILMQYEVNFYKTGPKLSNNASSLLVMGSN
jgi:hypothetical protein